MSCYGIILSCVSMTDDIMSWEKGLLTIAGDRDVTGEMLRVLLVLLAKVEVGSSTLITQAEIARILGMKRQNVSKAINRLVAKGIISKRIESGKILGYRVVDHFGYRIEGGSLPDVASNATSN